jgi:hypothetical protein
MRHAVWTLTAAALVSWATATTTTPFRPPGWLAPRLIARDVRGGSTAPKKKKEEPAEEEEPVTVDAELLYLPGLLDTVITRTRKVRNVVGFLRSTRDHLLTFYDSSLFR